MCPLPGCMSSKRLGLVSSGLVRVRLAPGHEMLHVCLMYNGQELLTTIIKLACMKCQVCVSVKREV